MSPIWLLCAFYAGGVLLSPYLRRESRLVRIAYVTAYSLLMVRYIFWRATTLPELQIQAATLFGYAFFVLEATATFMALDDYRSLRRSKNRSGEVDDQLDWYADEAPRVDVLIVSYNESWEVLEKTVVGAKGLNYPNYAVWILDDGNRQWLRDKSAEHGIGYVSRTENVHYKAGNLNNGIAALRARGIALEYLAVLDADFVARPEFLRRTMALMKTDDIGIVQSPQCFYNPDPHQQAFGGVKRWPDEQRAWFDIYLPSLDALDSATCCGTSCLIRVKALDAIGGFPTASVCEDTLTSIKMRQLGWKTVFLQEPLTVGLAPEGIGEFLTQRARWLLGGVQNDRYCGPGPGWTGRLRFWLCLWRSAIFGLLPPLWVTISIVFWFTGVPLIPIEDMNAAVWYFGPLWLCRFAEAWIFGGRQGPFVSDAVWMLLCPLWIRETYRAVLGSKARFKVTDKAQHRDSGVIHWQLLWFHGTLLCLLVAGFVYNMVDPAAPAYGDGFVQANTALTFWWSLVILAGVAPMFEPPRRRTAERYPTQERVAAFFEGQTRTWRVKDLSLGGLLVTTNGEELPRSLELELDGLSRVRAELVREHARNEAAFAFVDPAVRPSLIRRLYCTDDYIARPERWSTLVAICSVIKRVVF